MESTKSFKLFIKKEPTINEVKSTNNHKVYILGHYTSMHTLVVLDYVGMEDGDLDAFEDTLPGGVRVVGVVGGDDSALRGSEGFLRGRIGVHAKSNGRVWSWFSVDRDGIRTRRKPSKQKRDYGMIRVVGRFRLGEMMILVKEEDLDMKKYVSEAVMRALEKVHVFVGTRSERSIAMLRDAKEEGSDDDDDEVKARFVSTNLFTTFSGNEKTGLRAVLSGNLVVLTYALPEMSVRDVAASLREDICRSIRARLCVYGKQLVLGKDRSRISLSLGPRCTSIAKDPYSAVSSYKLASSSSADFKQWEVVGDMKNDDEDGSWIGYTPLLPSSSTTTSSKNDSTDTKTMTTKEEMEDEETYEIELVDSGDQTSKDVGETTTTTTPEKQENNNNNSNHKPKEKYTNSPPRTNLLQKYHYLFAIILALILASLHFLFNDE